MLHSETISTPALLGGTAVRPDGPPHWPRQSGEVEQALQQCWQSGDWGRYHGNYVTEFEQQLRDFHQVENVVLCSSGSSALELALRGVKVQPDDEVIMAAYDFKANFQNVLLLGAVPVLVDVRADNFQIDVAQIEQAITNKTKAIIVSHLHGGMVDLHAVREVASKKGIALVEDACQCQGAMFDGKPVGTWGDVGILSFGGSKLTTAGRGGAVLTNEAAINQRIKLHQERGNLAYPLSELQAAVLIPQWRSLQADNQQRAQFVKKLSVQLEEFSGLEIFDNSGLTKLSPEKILDVLPGYYKVGFRYQADEWNGLSRELFCEALRAEGIAFNPGFRALHKTHSPRRFRAVNDLLVAGEADEQIVGLHHPVLLESENAVAETVTALQKVKHYAKDIIKQKESPK